METKDKHLLLNFLDSQNLLAIATVDEQQNPWICNVYYCNDDTFTFYFLSKPDTQHSKHVLENSNVAFTVCWYNQNDLKDRKAIQAKGIMEHVTDVTEIEASLTLYNDRFSSGIDATPFLQNPKSSPLYKISTSYIKFWSDKDYGEKGIKEFFIKY